PRRTRSRDGLSPALAETDEMVGVGPAPVRASSRALRTIRCERKTRALEATTSEVCRTRARGLSLPTRANDAPDPPERTRRQTSTANGRRAREEASVESQSRSRDGGTRRGRSQARCQDRSRSPRTRRRSRGTNHRRERIDERDLAQIIRDVGAIARKHGAI